MPTLGQVLEIRSTLTEFSLTDLDLLRAALDRETTGLSLGTQQQLASLLGAYVARDDETEAALRTLLPTLFGALTTGQAALLQGPARSGKSHLLAVLALLGEYPALWHVFLETHPHFTALHQTLRPEGQYLIVPVPLEEHRGQEERLENIVFDRTERELSRERYNVHLPLSAESYALDLIERHALPRYRQELNEHVRQHVGGFSSWEQLRDRRPEESITVAQIVARQIGYPLDFRQSRTERLSRLMQILPQAGCRGVVWLLDDLSGFLAAAGPKAAHDDYAFLEFLGRRSRLEPLSLLAALEEGLGEQGEVEPYLLSNLRSIYLTRVELSPEPLRKVAHQALRFADGDRGRQALVTETFARYQESFEELSFTLDQLQRSYPLHPLAEQCLETIGRRYLGQADTVLQFFLAPAGRGGLRDFAQWPAERLLGPGEVVTYLEPVALMHPEAAPFFHEALDFYRKNAAQLVPENPQAALALVNTLLILRLGGITAPVRLLSELLGPAPSGTLSRAAGEGGSAAGAAGWGPQLPLSAPERGLGAEAGAPPPALKPSAVTDILETLRLMGSYVDVRRGPDLESSFYLLDVQTNLTELVRRRLHGVKQGLADDDPRLWRRVLAATDSPSFPLSELLRPQPYEVNWENSLRGVQVQLVNFTTLGPAEAAVYCQEALDPDNPEDCYLLMGQLSSSGAQLTAWQQIAQNLPDNRWTSALLAWIPRPLAPAELDTLKHCAACHELLRQPPPEGEIQAAWRGRLLEERLALDNAVRTIAQTAFYEGQVYLGDQILVAPADLALVKGDWTATVNRVVEPALERLFPEFPSVAPRHPVTTRAQLDLLVRDLISPLQAPRGQDDTLDGLAESVLGPLRLVTLRENHWEVSAQGKVVDEVLARVRQRDQTPEHERGRLLHCADLATNLLKSPLGLPPELFELVLATLVRTGYLEAFDQEHQPFAGPALPLPFAQQVQFVARPPLLPWTAWQVLSRVTRVVLGRGIPSPGYAEQAEVWESLLEERERQSVRLQQMRHQLDALRTDLGQSENLWSDSLSDLVAAEDFFRHLETELPPAEGLSRFTDWLGPHLTEGTGAGALSSMLRRLDRLEKFLQESADEIVGAQAYIESPLLVANGLPELETRRAALDEVISRGEALVEDQLTFHRQLQMLLTTYQRRYLAWHSRVHRNSAFEQFRAAKTTPEYRALSQLQPLDVRITYDLAHVGELIEDYESRRCTYTDLAAALTREPVCPQCRLKFGEEIDLPPVEGLLEAINHGLREYLAVLTSSEFRQKVSDYAAAMPYRREISARLQAVVDLSPEPSPRELISVFTDEVIAHLNRILAGKMVAPRNLEELRQALAGKTLTREEAQRLFMEWMDAGRVSEDDDFFRIEE